MRRDHLLQLLVVLPVLLFIPLPGQSQSRSKLEGMWSDPPASIVGSFCSFSCTDAGIDRLNALLDNPANDARPYEELAAEAKKYEREYLRSRLTGTALRTFPLDPADDPGFLRCEPWGVARQMIAPHQFEIRQVGRDRLEFRYGEWDARRTIYLDGRKRPVNQPPSAMGHSLGHWDGDTLIVETSGIAANIAGLPDLATTARHSDQLRIVERYTRSKEGNTLQLTVTMEDPPTFREPVVLKKIWRWAPESKITPYENCQAPTEFKKGVRP